MLLEESVNSHSPGTDIQHAMRNDLHRARESSVKGRLQLSQQEMHAPMATPSLELPLSLLFRLPTQSLLAPGWMNCSLLGKSICSRPKSRDTKTCVPRSRNFSREIAAEAETGTPASAWDAGATLKSCDKTVLQELQPSQEAGR
jgi:hypothetical protein